MRLVGSLATITLLVIRPLLLSRRHLGDPAIHQHGVLKSSVTGARVGLHPSKGGKRGWVFLAQTKRGEKRDERDAFPGATSWGLHSCGGGWTSIVGAMPCARPVTGLVVALAIIHRCCYTMF